MSHSSSESRSPRVNAANSFNTSTMAASMPPRPSTGRQYNTFNPYRSSTCCTHRNLTRLYDHYRLLRCSMCHRIPDLGFVYRCTQETNGNLPDSDFVDEDKSMDIADLRMKDGPATSKSSDDSTIISSHSMTNTLSTNAAVRTDDPMEHAAATDEALARAYVTLNYNPTEEPVEQPSNCEIRICPSCRPGFKERAWQSLNAIVDTSPTIPSHFEIGNRRVSNARTILNMDPTRERQSASSQHATNDLREQSQQAAAVENSDELTKLKNLTRSQESRRLNSVQHSSISQFRAKKGQNDSDADDEKGFANDDQDSDDSSSDLRGWRETWNETQDSSPRSKRVSHDQRPAADEQATPQDEFEDTCVATDHGAADSREKGKENQEAKMEELRQLIKEKATPGRFLID